MRKVIEIITAWNGPNIFSNKFPERKKQALTIALSFELTCSYEDNDIACSPSFVGCNSLQKAGDFT
jgi:hypothetical protein